MRECFVCMCSICVQCLQRPEEGTGSPEIEIIHGCSHHAGARNQTWVLCKSRGCSEPLSHLSRSMWHYFVSYSLPGESGLQRYLHYNILAKSCVCVSVCVCMCVYVYVCAGTCVCMCVHVHVHIACVNVHVWRPED